jgi:hypothetical protein
MRSNPKEKVGKAVGGNDGRKTCFCKKTKKCKTPIGTLQ